MNILRLFFLAAIVGFLSNANAQVRLPKIVQDSMILQRDAKVNIWGWAKNGEKVSVKFAGKRYKTTTDKDGKWQVVLAPQKAGGPYTMVIDASNHLTIKNILMGDVWFCSGQSNMVHQMALHNVRYEKEIAEANNDQIRHFWVPNLTNLQGPQNDLPSGSWKSANPENVLQFSAVAYFFAKKLYEKYKVPIGLINASWGGTPIEAWMSEDGFKSFLSISTIIDKNKDTAYVNNSNRKALNAARPSQQKDLGTTGAINWYDQKYIPKGWRSINIPGYWEDQGIRDLDGVVWYRKEVNIPASIASQQAKVFLGRIVDADVLYINGKQVGNTTYMYPQRRYNLPNGTLVKGKNVFVIRVTNNGGKGGFVPDKPYQLIAGNDTLDLKGEWQYKVGQVFTPQRGMGGGGIALQNQPTALYNAMVAPLTSYTIKGFAWYQGESNTGKPEEYASLQATLIKDWRSKWQQPNAPFLYVQLPGFMEMSYLPSESQWALFREAQTQSLNIPNTAMAIAIDLGEWNDIHPDRKKEVGDRLALAAMKVAYGENDVVSTGPMYLSHKKDGDKIIITFNNTGSGLTTNDDEPPRMFAIAGADKKFIWAEAKIERDKVIVWNDGLADPLYVRYAWADNPAEANLYNKEGLPASPFRTDVSDK